MKKMIAGLMSLAMVGCASHASSIEARYVSPTMYENWSCEQLGEERQRLAAEARRVAGLQDENADADAAMMGVGLILFWPALIGLAATEDREQELAQLKGEYKAADQAARRKVCSLEPVVIEEAEKTEPNLPQPGAPGRRS
ncbi:hypothetical protein QMT40_001429 [Parvibaculaceae bacterium PLY_AMNH_Bact1]|nr:hypothetical protein QMT40_001429 [Parvibaculaceae bacterium PLY_AMNH_Bact1]